MGLYFALHTLESECGHDMIAFDMIVHKIDHL